MATLAAIQRLFAMAEGGWVAASLHTAAVLGIADLLVRNLVVAGLHRMIEGGARSRQGA
jgi:hypothetical protein